MDNRHMTTPIIPKISQNIKAGLLPLSAKNPIDKAPHVAPKGTSVVIRLK